MRSKSSRFLLLFFFLLSSGLLPGKGGQIEKTIAVDWLRETKRCLKALFSQQRNTLQTLEEYFSRPHDPQDHALNQESGEIYSRIIEFYLDMYRRTGKQLYIKKAVYFSEIKNSYIHFKDFSLASIREKLRPGQLIVKYTVLKENSYVFCIDNRSVHCRKLTAGTREILNKIKQLTEPLDDFTGGSVDYLRIHYDLQAAHRLHRILLHDIPRPRENIAEVFIIPDRELFKLPFEALVTGFNQQELDPDTVFSEYSSADYLIEKFPVSYFFSLFHFLKETMPLKRKKYPYKITAFGSPAARKGKRFFPPLPSSKKEILSIRAIFGEKESRVFLDGDFNKDRFKDYAPLSGILHIATHFINDLNYPQNSALLFSPPGNGKGTPFYYAHEIFKLKLNTQLVVLSACESSEKHLLGLQGLCGITASFRHAGVRSMMVSMWPVDELSSELIPIFYREYNKNENNREISFASALRSAKLKLMKKTKTMKKGLKISFSHPFLWANYILYEYKPGGAHFEKTAPPAPPAKASNKASQKFLRGPGAVFSKRAPGIGGQLND